MSKFKNKDLDTILGEDMIDNDIESISIEEIDKEIEDFYIDKEKIESIKAPEDMRLWVREAAQKAQHDMKKEKRIKYAVSTAASIFAVLIVGSYNPALAHKLPALEKFLNNVNDTLRIDEISSFLGIDKIIQKDEVNEEQKIIKPLTEQTNDEDTIENDNVEQEVEVESKVESENEETMMFGSREGVVDFVHEMANSIIVPEDNLKYGQLEITPENIDLALANLSLFGNESERNYYESELTKWKQGDFENAKSFHNYIWESLGGDVGRAKSNDDSSIREIKSKYFE